MIILLLLALFMSTNAYAAHITVYGDVHKDVEFFTRTFPWIIDNIGGELYVEYYLLGSGRYSVPQTCALRELLGNTFLQAQFLRCEAKEYPSEYCLCEAGINAETFKACVAQGGYLASSASSRFSELDINISPIVELELNSTVYGVDDVSFLQKICTNFGDQVPRGCVHYSNQTDGFLAQKALAQFDRACQKEFLIENDRPVPPTTEAPGPEWHTTSTPWSTTSRPWGSTTSRPWGSTTSWPWGSTTSRPWGSTTSHPWGSTTSRPWGSTTSWPWGSTTSRPWGSTTSHPWGSTTSWPWGSTTSRPWGSTTSRPWGSTTSQPWGSTTSQPWGSTTSNPWGSTTSQPWGSTTSHPWGSTTSRPWGSTTSQPWGSTTSHPWGSTTSQPWGSTTSQPWGSTTSQPWGSTTSRPWASTTSSQGVNEEINEDPVTY